MRFTLSWLKKFLDTKASLETIAHTLTMTGLEVEEISAEEDSASMPLVSRTRPVRPPGEDRGFTRISINPNRSGSRSIFSDQVLLNRKDIRSAAKVNEVARSDDRPELRQRLKRSGERSGIRVAAIRSEVVFRDRDR